MIPFIVGGVALAATGYGVAKLLEDGCSSSGGSNFESDSLKNTSLGFILSKAKGIDKQEDRDDSNYPTQEFTVNLDEKAYEPQEDESLGKYDLAKIELYNTSFIELTTALQEIRNLPHDIHIPDRLKFAQTIYPFEEVTKELEEDFDRHREILQNSKKYIDSKLDALDALIISGNDFEEYSEEDKKLVQNLVEIFKLIERAVFSKTTNDGVTIAREVKRAFTKVEILVNNQKEV